MQFYIDHLIDIATEFVRMCDDCSSADRVHLTKTLKWINATILTVRFDVVLAVYSVIYFLKAKSVIQGLPLYLNGNMNFKALPFCTKTSHSPLKAEIERVTLVTL